MAAPKSSAPKLAESASSFSMGSDKEQGAIGTSSLPWYRQRKYQVFIGLCAVAAIVAIAVPVAVVLSKKDTSTSTPEPSTAAPTSSNTDGPMSLSKRLCTDTEITTSLVVNEIYPHKPQDWVELYNTNKECDVVLTGWSMLDDNSTHVPLMFKGACERVPAGGFLVLEGAEGKMAAKECQFDYGLADKKDSVLLYNGMTLQANVTWSQGMIGNKTSWARLEDGTYSSAIALSKGAFNSV